QLGGVAAVGHRRRGVDEEGAAQLGLLLEPLHVVAVELAEGLPVDVFDVVAGRVLLVLGELDRRAVMRGAVHARQRTLDDRARAHRQVLEAAELQRREEPHGYSGRTTSRRRSMSSVARTPSASAWKLVMRRCCRTGRASART